MEVIALSAAAAQVTKFNGNGGHIQGGGNGGFCKYQTIIISLLSFL